MQNYYLGAVSALALVCAGAPAQAFANEGAASQDAGKPLDTEITVTASGHAQPIDQTGQAISVMGADELQALQGADVARALVRLPGVAVARSGGLGTQTSLFVRGANSEHLVVLIDGVRVGDLSSPAGGYDFGGLMAGGLGKVELLRGSNSVIWGSDALGGVLAITSRELNGAQASVEYGSHQSWSTQATVGLARQRYAVSVDAGYDSTDSIPTLATDTQSNPFHQAHVAGRARLQLAQGLNLLATGRYADGKLSLDSYEWPTGYVNHGEYQLTQQASGRGALDYTHGTLQLTAGVALNDQRRAYVDPTVQTSAYSTYMGRATTADLTGHVGLPAGFALDFGGDTRWDKARTYYFGPGVDARDRLSSGHGLLGWHGGGVSLAAGLRVDDHSTFGSHTSFGANGTVALMGDVRLRASYGEGFKTPSLYELFSAYGSATLRPETSQSYDVGLEKGSRAGKLHGALTWFHRDTTNLIDFVSCASVGLCASRPYGVYANVAQARAKGFELEGDARPIEGLQLHAAYTYTQTRNLSVGSANYGKQLARRPRNTLTLSADWQPLAGEAHLSGLTLGTDVRFADGSYDNAANSVANAGYVVVGLRAALPVGAHAELYGRVENLTNASYQQVAGYNQLGRTGTIGLRVKL